MKRNTTLYISDIIEYIERAENYIKDLSYKEFFDDCRTIDKILGRNKLNYSLLNNCI